MNDTLLVLEAPVAGGRLEIAFPGKILGRADFLGPLATEVSRKHAKIYFKDGHWRICDLGSTNGITINDCPLRDCILCWGDRLGLGPVECLVTENEDLGALTARARELVGTLFLPGQREKSRPISQKQAA